MGRRTNLRGPCSVLRLGLGQSEGSPLVPLWGRVARRKRRFMEPSAGRRVRSLVSITMESRTCSGCGIDLSAPALATPAPEGPSWWCRYTSVRSEDGCHRTFSSAILTI